MIPFGLTGGQIGTGIVAVGGIVGGGLFELWRRFRASPGPRSERADVADQIATSYEKLVRDWRDRCTELQARCNALEKNVRDLDAACHDLRTQCDAVVTEGARIQRECAESLSLHEADRKALLAWIEILLAQLRSHGIEPATRPGDNK